MRALLEKLDIVGSRIEITPQTLAGKNRNSPMFFLSYLVCRRAGATDWWSSVVISGAAEHDQKLEYHHIHPRATLAESRGRYTKAEINDLANIAFISQRANRKIARRSPAAYFSELGTEELQAHFVPLSESLRDAGSYREFLAARRQTLADAMNRLLEEFRPAWLNRIVPEPDPAAGATLDFTVYDSDWDHGRVAIRARFEGAEWAGHVTLPDLEAALDAATSGLDADLEVGTETVSVQGDGEILEIPIGPFRVTGSPESWWEIVEREKEHARPLSQFTKPEPQPWTGVQTPFPVASVD